MGPRTEYRQSIDSATEDFSSRRGTPSIALDGFYSRQSSAMSRFSMDGERLGTPEGRFSRALQTWMSDYEYSSLKPKEKPPFQPVYSGKLGKTDNLKRSNSEDSLVTMLSLLSCSTEEIEKVEIVKKKKKPRKVNSSKASSAKQRPTYTWVEVEKLSRATKGEFITYMQTQNVMAMDNMCGLNDDDDSLFFQMLDNVEKRAINRVGLTTGVKLINNLKKSGSTTNIKEEVNKSKPTRVGSAGSTPRSKAINIQEIKRQRINQKLAILQKQQQNQSKKHKGALLPKRATSTSRMSNVSDVSSIGAINSPSVRSESPEVQEQISVWKGDREILEMDLKKGLTSRAMRRIKSTTAALARVTGFGETNESQRVVGRHEEFPYFVDEDYGAYPKIVQRIRVSPELSNVITSDIKIRMGRPRYHEIREKDLEVWNRGQTLGRFHRNLKVFNWLHSLREDEFVLDIESQIDDVPPTDDEVVQVLHVESADEPDVKPLYMKKFWD